MGFPSLQAHSRDLDHDCEIGFCMGESSVMHEKQCVCPEACNALIAHSTVSAVKGQLGSVSLSNSGLEGSLLRFVWYILVRAHEENIQNLGAEDTPQKESLWLGEKEVAQAINKTRLNLLKGAVRPCANWLGG